MSFRIKTTAKTSGRPDLTQAGPSQQSIIGTDDHHRQITGPIFGKVEMVQNRPSFLPFYVDEGMRNVVRVKRFDRGATGAGGSSNLYVLDLVVESLAATP